MHPAFKSDEELCKWLRENDSGYWRLASYAAERIETLNSHLSSVQQACDEPEHTLLSTLQCCPECGSGDVALCNTSKRPHCNECNYWPAINYTGTMEDAIKSWNKQALEAGR